MQIAPYNKQVNTTSKIKASLHEKKTIWGNYKTHTKNCRRNRSHEKIPSSTCKINLPVNLCQDWQRFQNYHLNLRDSLCLWQLSFGGKKPTNQTNNNKKTTLPYLVWLSCEELFFPCLAWVRIWKSYSDPEKLFVYADALWQCAWVTTYRPYTACKDDMFPGRIYLKLPIKKWLHMVRKGPWSLIKLREGCFHQNNLFDLSGSKTREVSVSCSPNDDSLNLLALVQLCYCICCAAVMLGSQSAFTKKKYLFQRSASPASHTGSGVHAEHVWLYNWLNRTWGSPCRKVPALQTHAVRQLFPFWLCKLLFLQRHRHTHLLIGDLRNFFQKKQGILLG